MQAVPGLLQTPAYARSSSRTSPHAGRGEWRSGGR
ncbi:hypothetical protein ACGFRB_01405 [Streptomyces sp. NPDC048718]